MISVLDENVNEASVLSKLILLLSFSIGVDEVVTVVFDMRVKDDSHESSRVFDFLVHGSESIRGEVLWVESEVLVSGIFTLVVSPLDVHDENINWEVEAGEVGVSLTDDVRRGWGVLGVVESKSVHWWEEHWSTDVRDSLLNSLVTVQATLLGLDGTGEEEELKSTRLTYEVVLTGGGLSSRGIIDEYPGMS